MVAATKRIRLYPRGGGTLIFSKIYVGSGHFLRFKILNLNSFGGFQKNEYFWGV